MREVEVFLGITFPDEVKASYHFHNGSHGQQLVGDPEQNTYQLSSFEEMMSDWQQEINLQRQIDQRAERSRQERMKMRLQQREDWMDEDDLTDVEEKCSSVLTNGFSVTLLIAVGGSTQCGLLCFVPILVFASVSIWPQGQRGRLEK